MVCVGIEPIMKKTTTTRKRGDARTLQRVPTQTPRIKGTGVPEPELYYGYYS